MGTVRRSKCSWCSTIGLLAFASVFALWPFTVNSAVLVSEKELSNPEHGRRNLHDIGGSINIDCGIPKDSSYTDEKTELHYVSDAEFIDSGENKKISSEFNTETLQKSLLNVRSFPQGNRSCYTLKPAEGKGTNYFIRATFMYGNYDEQNQLPEFGLYVGVNEWDTIKFENASDVVIKEIIHAAVTDDVYVCLRNTGSGTPFMSTLELRHFDEESYNQTESTALLLYRRYDLGSTTGQIVRFKEDAYDRMWFPYNLPQSRPINTSLDIDTLERTEYELPSTVMRTAVVPENANDTLHFELDAADPTLTFYPFLHFAELEILKRNESREFNIDINGKLWFKAVVPKYLSSETKSRHEPVRGPNLNFSLSKTQSSTHPPILNAMEVYRVKDFLNMPTHQDDVDAIMEIKNQYRVSKFWEGDPCLPLPAWDGLQCSDNGYKPRNITALNLSSSGLTGTIPASIGRLKSLQYLDLSNNSLTGTLPKFLLQLPDLRTVDLSGNKLSGSVPSDFSARIGDGSLSVDGNPDLCVTGPCKKEEKKKNLAVPIIAAVVSSVVVLSVLALLWSYRRKQVPKQVARTHLKGSGRSLKLDNRHFTYNEVLNITNNFQTIIGKGGFGTVYHGLLSDGTQVAVKMLSPSSTQGSDEFLTEVQLLMRVHHRNLVSFTAYCNEGTNIGIIYEYMARGNLAEYLSDKRKDTLTWKARLQIAVDAAQGLEYLHHGCKPPIIHRDVKTTNILLNEKMQAKIADFGLSKCFQVENQSQSHLLTTVVGTLGYLDPEYYNCNRLTERSDVFSFGVVLLEIITGRPALIKSEGNAHIIQWVSAFLERGDIRGIVDPRLQGYFNINSGWKAVETAMACVPLNSNQRPTMSHVLMELKECLEIELAYEQSLETQGVLKESRNTFEMSPLGSEIDTMPLAR
ncbi:putative leucine-rich repeat receptor-like serine/threonine-protein kinase At2g19230 [Juglans regia]|uniref:non-specific serine/threonine protein kinase n=1 Tax=Juglans regia TaxID=51240 RepID=A0A6P9E4Q0_JUGRE|nr:putative leucine-rich repeat receptor-like serine/threonine-protein kinase At2g19230 [Juglans regia]